MKQTFSYYSNVCQKHKKCQANTAHTQVCNRISWRPAKARSQGISLGAQQGEQPLGMPDSIQEHRFKSWLLYFCSRSLLSDPGMQWRMAQRLENPVIRMRNQMEFLGPGFGLGQMWLLGSLRD